MKYDYNYSRWPFEIYYKFQYIFRKMSKTLEFMAVAGPTYSDTMPPFDWRKIII